MRNTSHQIPHYERTTTRHINTRPIRLSNNLNPQNNPNRAPSNRLLSIRIKEVTQITYSRKVEQADYTDTTAYTPRPQLGASLVPTLTELPRIDTAPPAEPSNKNTQSQLHQSSVSLLQRSQINTNSTRLTVHLPQQRAHSRPSPIRVHPFHKRQLTVLTRFSTSKDISSSFERLNQALINRKCRIIIYAASPAGPTRFTTLISSFTVTIVIHNGRNCSFRD